MSGNANAIRKSVKEWLRHADEDLRLAQHAFKLKSAVPYKLIAYHAQQCAEKSLKAYLVYKHIDFPYTHNISVLLEMLPPSAVENWECEQIFFHKPLLVLEDPKHSLTEKRWAAFGRTDSGRLLVVVFTQRKSMIRVISARDMNSRERKFYETNG